MKRKIRICPKCGNKIENASSIWQEYCNNCHKGKESKGGKLKMVKTKEAQTEEAEKKPVKKESTSTHIECSKCGSKMYCSAERLAKLIKKVGSEEEVRKGYVCRKCKKESK